MDKYIEYLYNETGFNWSYNIFTSTELNVHTICDGLENILNLKGIKYRIVKYDRITINRKVVVCIDDLKQPMRDKLINYIINER